MPLKWNLILHGTGAPHIKPEEVTAFIESLRRGTVDWQMIYYGNAVLSFVIRKPG
jgi:hypothetical protein